MGWIHHLIRFVLRWLQTKKTAAPKKSAKDYDEDAAENEDEEKKTTKDDEEFNDDAEAEAEPEEKEDEDEEPKKAKPKAAPKKTAGAAKAKPSTPAKTLAKPAASKPAGASRTPCLCHLRANWLYLTCAHMISCSVGRSEARWHHAGAKGRPEQTIRDRIAAHQMIPSSLLCTPPLTYTYTHPRPVAAKRCTVIPRKTRMQMIMMKVMRVHSKMKMRMG